MKTKFILLLGCLALASSVTQAAQLGTGINYQGRLTDGGNPASGTHSFRYRLVADPAGTTQIGPMVDLPNQNVSGGLFNAQLDFGAGAFSGQERWLEISVKTGGPGAAQDYIKLNPQPLPPGGSSQFARIAGDVLDAAITGPRIAPLAITSGNLADGAVTAAKLGAGSVGSSQIADGSITAADIGNNQVVKSLNGLRDTVTLAAGANVTLTPSGNTVTISSAGPGGAGIWTALNGNTYYNGGNVGIGTAAPSFPFHLNSGATASSVLAALLEPNLANGGFNQIYLGRTASANGCATFTYSYNAANPDQSLLSLGLYSSSYALNVRGDGSVIVNSGNFFWGDSSLHRDQGGAIKLGNSLGNGNTPYLDFQYGVGAARDFNVRLINDADRRLSLHGNFNLVDGDISMKAQGQITSSGRLHIQANESLYLNPFAGAGDVIVGGGGGPGNLTVDGGVVELGNSSGNGNTPYLDFHYGVGAAQDFNVRLINDADGRLTCSGNFSVRTLTIRGGADLAEPFPMKEEQIDKGSVVVIDDEHPGRLKLSTRAYDTQVAGIVSGANGINPGISLTQEGALDQGQNVALTGRVYVKADASHGAIKPGDLLTTSDTPGHAMKVSEHRKSQGAILGKAMSALKEGTGLVLVLVTLQ